MHLYYESTTFGRPVLRRLAQAKRIRAQLGGRPSCLAAFPERPQGMSQRRYEALRRRVVEAERDFLAASRAEMKDVRERAWEFITAATNREGRSGCSGN
jgi:hypothetical protein